MKYISKLSPPPGFSEANWKSGFGDPIVVGNVVLIVGENASKMHEALDRVDSRGGTALYDSVIASADHLAKGAKREKIVEASNGVSLGDPPIPHLPGGRIVFVGWVTREKGVFEALDVLAGVRVRHPSATLTIVGGGRDLDAFTLDVEGRGLQGVVRITGWLSYQEVQRTLREGDVFLFPSHFEGLPNAVVEAMAAGLPVVATRVGGVPDLIRHGESGFLVDVGDIASMTMRVNQLLAQPDRAQEIGRRGRVDRCDIERVWPRYAQALHAAAARAGRGSGAGSE